MATPTETYVDPAIAAASGAGTIGDPFGDIQHALDTITRDSTGGDRINILNGTDEILAAALSLATYGTPTAAAPLILQGYTSVAGDGGQGGVDCNSFTSIAAAGTDHISLIDLHLHNAGSATIVAVDNAVNVFRCEINNTSGGGIDVDNAAIIAHNNIYDVGGTGIQIQYGTVFGNYLSNSTKTFSEAINITGAGGSSIRRNIITIGGASNGIILPFGQIACTQNSILSAGGTGTGIELTSAADIDTLVLSNLVEGFSGAGGIGIDFNSTEHALLVENNAVYNNTTNYDLSGAVLLTGSDNETLSASPFAKSGSDTFANRKTYFAPVDTGNVFGGAFQ